ncbi:MAG TPA: hypothetical protein PKW96_09815 [Candidatus Aminicenantes bacterium]|nr:hypothetical protein [Candidatus Aminicenantes bacterium]
MRLKSKPTFIRTGDEPAPKRPFKIGRFVYVGFLLLLLVFLAIKLGGSFFYVRGVGQIEASRLNVQELTDVRLLKMLVKEGQEVKKGDPLFTFLRWGAADVPVPQETTRLAPLQDGLKLSRDLLDLERQIRLKELERNDAEERLGQCRKGVERVRTLVSQNAALESEALRLEENCSKIAFQRKSAEEEIKFFRREIGLLNESRTTMASSGRGRQTVLYLGSWKDSIKADERRLAAAALGWPIFASSRQGMAIALYGGPFTDSSEAFRAQRAFRNARFTASVVDWPMSVGEGGSVGVGASWKDHEGFSEVVLSLSKPVLFDIQTRPNGVDIFPREPFLWEGAPSIPASSPFITTLRSGVEGGRQGIFVDLRGAQVVRCWEYRSPYRLVLEVRPSVAGQPQQRKGIECVPVWGELFRSPLSGMVTRIYFGEYEVALKGEQIMNIYQSGGNMSIKAFFEQKDLLSLEKGRPVEIEFPDGIKVSGKISRLYSATLAQPPEFQKKYEPTHRNVVVDVILDDPSLVRDRDVDRLGVKLYIRKKLF